MKINLLSILLCIVFFSLVSFKQTNAQNFMLAFCYKNTLEPDSLDKIFSVLEDSSFVQLSNSYPISLDNPDWSPSGEKIAVVGTISDNQKSIYIFDILAPSNLTILTQMDTVWDIGPDWSPCGGKILFTRFYINQNFRSELWVMDSTGSNPHPIGIDGAYGRWSPEGSHIVYHFFINSNYEIGICEADGSDSTQITYTSSINEIAPTYSPDGMKLSYTSIDGSGIHDICIMDVNGGNIKNLTANFNGGGAPKWAPSGDKIAFHNGGNIFTIDTSGSNLKQITNYSNGEKAINPDWYPVSINEIKQSNNLFPKKIHLYQNFPNPFNSSTNITYNLAESIEVRLSVYNLLGEKITTLVDGVIPAGHNSVVWNGTDDNGEKVSSGLYIYKLEAREILLCEKMLSIK